MTNPQPVLFVAGLGRCGTTLVMTMLDAGGFPVTGPRPAYEPSERWIEGKADVNWISEQGGRAVKWIDPTRNLALLSRLSEKPVIILLDRNPKQQALSQLKLLGMPIGRTAENRMRASICRDMPALVAKMKRETRLYRLTFEKVLADPAKAAELLGAIVAEEFGRDFDADTASRVVINREPRCLPNLKMEETILPVLAADMPAPAQV